MRFSRPRREPYCAAQSINQDGLVVLGDFDLPASERERALMPENVIGLVLAGVVSADVEHAAADGDRREDVAVEGSAEKQRAAAERQGRVFELVAKSGVSDHVELAAGDRNGGSAASRSLAHRR